MNNAFIMKMGKYVFIEFGMTGNACYFYKADELPFNLDQGTLSIHKLKSVAAQARRHRANAWETLFDDEFCPLINFWPEGSKRLKRTSTPTVQPAYRPSPSQPSPTDLGALLNWCQSQGIKVEDNRSKGGSLWIRANGGETGGFNAKLIRMGFKFKAGKGYWKD